MDQRGTHDWRQRLARLDVLFAATALGAAGLSACSDGGSTSVPAPGLSLSGTAATGLAAANAVITVKCAGSPAAFTTTAGLDGRFSVNVNQVPCVVRATFGSPAQTLYSIATQSGILNISPLTDLVVAAYGQTSPDAFFNSFDPANPPVINSNALATAVALVKRRAANAGVNVDAIDLLRQSFNAQNGDAYDDALEALKLAPVTQSTLRSDVAAGRDGSVSTPSPSPSTPPPPPPAPTPPSPPPPPAPAPGAPQTPTGVLAEPGDGAARVSWSPAESGVSYTVYFDPTPGAIGPGSTWFPTQMSTGSSPLTITGLTNGTAYTFVVRANKGGVTADSTAAATSPHSYGLSFTPYTNCGSGTTGCFDPYRGNATYGGAYNAIAYTRYAGQDNYVAVKSNLQIMRAVDDTPPQHIINPMGGANLTTLNAIAGGDNGQLLAVGESGLLARSTDGGLTWSSVNYAPQGGTAAGTSYKSVTYGNGKFVAVGQYVDTFSNYRDVVLTLDTQFGCPANTSCTSFSGVSAYAPGNYSALLQVAYGGGRFVALGSNGYWRDAATYTLQFNSNASYTSTDANTWAFNTPTGTNSFPDNYGADKLVFFNGNFWGLALSSKNGGRSSTDGVTWPTSWQISSPGIYQTDMTVGVGQLVGVTATGLAYVNKTGGVNTTAWVNNGLLGGNTWLSNANNNERNLVVYGNGRYVAISAGSVYVSK